MDNRSVFLWNGPVGPRDCLNIGLQNTCWSSHIETPAPGWKRSWSHCDTRIVQSAAYTPTTHRQSHKTRLFPHLTCPHPVIHLTHCVFETSGRDYARCPVQ